MIKIASADDVPSIFDLFRRTYHSHSIFEQGGETRYLNQLLKGEYIGFVFVENNTILGHAGVAMGKEFALINYLVTDKRLRGKGIGKELFMSRESFCDASDRNFIIGYSMMQHPYSQLLYSNNFKPIGMVVGYLDIYGNSDEDFNKGNSNAEMVLCTKIKPEITISLEVPQICPDNRLYNSIIRTMSIKPNFTSTYQIPEGNIFSGLVPDLESGLFTFGLIKKDQPLNFDLMLTTNQDREDFKNEIRQCYQSTIL